MDFKDIGVRAFKTFLQVGIAALGADWLTGFDIEVLQTAGIAGASAGVAVIMNAVLAWASTD